MDKTCRKCGLTKPIGRFYAGRGMADGRLNVCKDCSAAANEERRRADPDRDRARHAAWRAKNVERMREMRARADGRYVGSEKWRAGRERRRLQKGTDIPSLRRVLALHGRTCHICTKPIPEDQRVHFDHVVPLARGGAHTEENLRPAHHSCNAWKGARLMPELEGEPMPDAFDVPALIRQRAAKKQGDSTRARFADMTPEERAAFGAKISVAKKGRPNGTAGITRKRKTPATPEEIARRSAAVRATYAAWTPEQRVAHAKKISDAKRARGSKGNIDNLRKGWSPEVHAKAIDVSAEMRRGTEHTEEHRAAIADGLKAAYADGRRKRGHTDETKRKISETKRARKA